MSIARLALTNAGVAHHAAWDAFLGDVPMSWLVPAIEVVPVLPPIPTTQFDYAAYVAGDPEGLTGRGATPEDATDDLIDQLQTLAEVDYEAY